jgi:NTE family protein
MKVDGVFSGGGIKAISFIGALQVAEEKGYQFERLAGTSAGAIISALLVAGYNSKDIQELVTNFNMKHFLDPRRTPIPFPALKWIKLYWKLGLYKGDALESWLSKILASRGIRTFGDLKEGSLQIVASDITRGRILTLPDDLHDYGLLPEKFPVAKAVRMSASLPYFFEPVKLYTTTGKRCLIVDGGVLSNFPIWLFENNIKAPIRPILGFQLGPALDHEHPHKVDNAIELFQALFETMKEAHDARYISEAVADNIIFIPVQKVMTTDFNLSSELISELISFGRKRAEVFLESWRYPKEPSNSSAPPFSLYK